MNMVTAWLGHPVPLYVPLLIVLFWLVAALFYYLVKRKPTVSAAFEDSPSPAEIAEMEDRGWSFAFSMMTQGQKRKFLQGLRARPNNSATL